MSARSVAVWLALVALGCGTEPAGPGASDASTKASAKPAVTAADSVRASATARTSAPVASGSAAAPSAGLVPSDGNVAKLLEGGEALRSLPSRPVDGGRGFDPGLRQTLSPAVSK